jgi:uncharacterized protein YndB with AHSA1/START domain
MSQVVSLSHGAFTLNRSWAAPPARVFSAWADPHLKSQWFAPLDGNDSTAQRRHGTEFHFAAIEKLIIHAGGTR